MTPLAEAQSFVTEQCTALAPVATRLDGACGCVLGADVVAGEAVPPFDNSAVDGYAVISADTTDAPVKLAVVGELAAGVAPTDPVRPGQAIRIMTGAPMPSGADALVMVENTERIGDDGVLVNSAVAPGNAVRRAGDDVLPGDLLFEPGTELTPAVLGVLASVGVRSVAVHRRPRVAVLSTGDELVDDDRSLRAGEIRESNRRMLAALVRQTGCEVLDVGIVRDDEAMLEFSLRQAASTCDAIVSSGGVSMGDFDVVKAVLGRIAEMTWMQIAIKPAKPFAFGKVDGIPVFGLPGNPVSSLVSFELLARPALRKMMGHRDLFRPQFAAVVDQELERRPDGKLHLMRVIAAVGDDGRFHVRPARAQGSHQLAATALSNALAVVPDGDGVEVGGEVPIIVLGA